MSKTELSKVFFVQDLEELDREPQPILLVRPCVNRCYPYQNLITTAEVVDLARLNLEKVTTFETL